MRAARRKKPYVHPLSEEEAHMRAFIEAWGREKYPGARVVHQFPLPRDQASRQIPRVSMAFIGERSIAGIIIKCSRSIIHDLPMKTAEAVQWLPELWVFADIRHSPKLRGDRSWAAGNCGLMIVAGNDFDNDLKDGLNTYNSKDHPRLFTPMLDLLTREELASVTKRRQFRPAMWGERYDYLSVLSRELTGEQIREEVCRELRARSLGWPVNLRGDPPIPIPALFRSAT